METAILALRVLLSLGAVLALVWWFQRRLTRGLRNSATEPLVRVVTRQAITPKASVVVLETGGQRFLLGVTEASVNVLHTSEAEPEPQESFEAYLEAAGAAEPAAQHARTGTTRPGTSPGTSPSARPGARPSARRRAEGPAHALNTAPPARPDSPLAGSVLSPATWRQAAAAMRRSRNG